MESDHTCGACGWPAWKQERVQYDSHIRLFCAEDDRAVWNIGTSHVLKERAPKSYTMQGSETACLKFLKDNSSIPVPVVVTDWIDNAGTHFILQERIQGVTLEDAWTTLSAFDKTQIADETAHCLAQLRNFQSSKMACFSGGAFVSNYLYLRSPSSLHGPFDSQDMFFDAMTKGFDLPERAHENLRKRMPNCEPYTLTNGGLDMSHILVESGHLVGIISWETAGYLPVWWEWVRASIAHGEEDNEWKSMLRERMEPCPEADEFYKDLYALGEKLFRTRFPRMDERKQQLLEALMEK